MKNIIQFYISKHDQYYTAEGLNVPVVTQAKTLDELTENVREAVQLELEGEDLSQFDLGEKPSILVNFELPTTAHA